MLVTWLGFSWLQIKIFWKSGNAFLPFHFFHPRKIYLKHTGHVSQRIGVVGLVIVIVVVVVVVVVVVDVCVWFSFLRGEGGAIHTKLLLQNAQ